MLRRLRRDGRLRQRVVLGAIGTGITLVAVVSLTSPLAGADTAARHRAHATAPSTTGPVVALPIAAAVTPAPVVRRTVPRTPVHVATPAPTDTRAISGLAANGIPSVALNAYRVAAARVAHVDPSCGVDWALIAGIGREESDHGRFGGAVLHADGVSTPAIVGPALDGVHWDYIPVSADYVRITGDKTFAHALGPMQFIPTTWASFGADADGDGRTNIFDINDAALGTARYLCAAGGNLRTHAGQVAGVLAYNHSDQYLAQVLALADAYRRGIPISGIPIGNITGALPTITPGGTVPAANPAAPTAADAAAAAAAAKAAAAKAAAAQAAARKAAAQKAAAQKAAAQKSAAQKSAAQKAAAQKSAAQKAAAQKSAAQKSAAATSKPSGSRPAPAPSSSSTRTSGSGTGGTGGGSGGTGSTGAPSGGSSTSDAPPSASSSPAAPAASPTCRLPIGSFCI